MYVINDLRSYQISLVQKAQEKENKFIVIQAPVGSGKSYIACALANESTLICTPEVKYVTQYANDTGLKTRGMYSRAFFEKMAKNLHVSPYGLLKAGLKFNHIQDLRSLGYNDKEIESAEHFFGAFTRGFNEILSMKKANEQYCRDILKDEAYVPVSTTLKAYFLLNAEYFDKTTLIIDEAHRLTPAIKLMFSFDLPDINTSLILNEYIYALISKIRVIAHKRGLAEELEAVREVIKKFEIPREVISASEKRILDEEDSIDDRRLVALDKMIDHTDNYSISVEDGVLKFDIIDIDFILTDFLGYFDKVYFLSGTAKTMKLPKITSDKAMLAVPYTFQKFNVDIKKTFDLKSTNLEDNLDSLINEIKRICTLNSGKRGIIHTPSYALAKKIYEHFEKDKRFDIYNPKNDDDLTGVIKRLLQRPDKVLISASCKEALDLKDDLCRFQILAKISLPNYGDARIRDLYYTRTPSSQALLNNFVLTGLEQVRGRGVRGKDDECILYILDSQIRSYIDIWKQTYDYFEIEK